MKISQFAHTESLSRYKRPPTTSQYSIGLALTSLILCGALALFSSLPFANCRSKAKLGCRHTCSSAVFCSVVCLCICLVCCLADAFGWLLLWSLFSSHSGLCTFAHTLYPTNLHIFVCTKALKRKSNSSWCRPFNRARPDAFCESEVEDCWRLTKGSVASEVFAKKVI